MPVNLHAVSQLHPQVGLLLGRHGLPALLNTGQGGIGDGMLGCGACLLGSNRLLLGLRADIQASHWAWDGAVGANGSRGHGRAASSSSRDGLKEHCAEGRARDKKRSIEEKALSRGYRDRPSELRMIRGWQGSGGGGRGSRWKTKTTFDCDLKWKSSVRTASLARFGRLLIGPIPPVNHPFAIMIIHITIALSFRLIQTR